MGKQSRLDFGDVRNFATMRYGYFGNSSFTLYLPPPCPEDNRRARDAEHGASADLRDDTRDDRRDVDGRRCRPSRGSRGR